MKISNASYEHLLYMDLNYHKMSSKNSVFSINRALSSIENGLKFLLYFFTAIIVELGLLSISIGVFCGPLYLVNFLFTFFLHSKFTREVSKDRMIPVREKKNYEKNKDFYLHESI